MMSEADSETWVACSDGKVPENAVIAGADSNGNRIYAGRAYYNGHLLPAKVICKDGAYVTYAGKEFKKTEYEVLTSISNYGWVESSGGKIAPNAIRIGESAGEPLFMGRKRVGGACIPGKVHPSPTNLHIALDGEEKQCKVYEVLVRL